MVTAHRRRHPGHLTGNRLFRLITHEARDTLKRDFALANVERVGLPAEQLRIEAHRYFRVVVNGGYLARDAWLVSVALAHLFSSLTSLSYSRVVS